MDEQERIGLALILNSLPFVRWDRMTGDSAGVVVYGWIEREDEHADFVLVEVDERGLSFTTSSAKWSSRISEILLGDSDHELCQRVEHELGELVSNVIRARA